MLAEEQDLQVVGEAGSAEDALQQLRDGLQVDVVVLDITLPGQSGIDLLKQLKRDQPELAILVLSMHPERSFAVRLMRAGANGYVPKMIVPEELVKAVRAVGTGRRYITPLVAELLASECAADEEGPIHNRLSERELQVFTRIARGISPAVMANELGSERQDREHLSRTHPGKDGHAQQRRDRGLRGAQPAGGVVPHRACFAS